MGLFDKKYCDFCGEKVGLFGKTTLKDGYICKHCASNISHWWSIGKASSVSDVHEHLQYRSENKQKVADFRVTKTMGEYYKILVDEDAARVMVTSSTDFAKSNPDVFELSDITSAEYEIDENKTELKDKDKDGKEVSFDPKRYEYKYDFYVTLYIKSPYFSTIRFKVNKNYVYINPWEEAKVQEAEAPKKPTLTPAGRPSLAAQEPRRPAERYTGIAPQPAGPEKYSPNTENNEDYQAYKQMAEEIVAFFNAKG